LLAYIKSFVEPFNHRNSNIVAKMAVGEIILRIFSNGVRILQFLAAAVILGIFSYFLAVLSNHDLPIMTWIRAVTGLSGAAALYALLGSLFTLCLGGSMFFGFIAMILDVCMIGAMVAIAILARDGTQSCSGNVNTPLGSGPSDEQAQGYGANGFGFGSGKTLNYLPNLGLACRLEKTAFAVSIISIFLFLVSLALQIPMVRHHRHEKRFGPSPANDYTYGSGRGWFRRKNRDEIGNSNSLPKNPTPGEIENRYYPDQGNPRF